MRSFFAELQRRKVYRVAIAYAVVAWVLIQIDTQVFPLFVATWAVKLIVVQPMQRSAAVRDRRYMN